MIGFGVHALVGQDVRQLAEDLVMHLHLNPANQYPNIFINSAANLTDPQLTFLALGAFVYTSIRFIEAYGLWQSMRWTEWLALVSGAIYLPFEIYEIIHSANVLSVGAFAINITIVGYLAQVLLSQRQLNVTKAA